MKNRARGWLPKLGVMTLGLLASLASPVRAQADEAEAAKPAAQEGAFVQPFEVGIFGGLHFFNKEHTLGRSTATDEGLSPDLGGAFGLRLTYNLCKWGGVELEGMLSPTHTRWSNDSGGMKYNVLGLRAHAIINFIHDGYVRPFALIGAGTLSGFPQYKDRGIDRDTDGYYHLGVGSKFPINDDFGVRFDGRVMAPFAIFSGIAKAGNETHWNGPDFELLLSAYLAFGGSRPTPPPPPPPAPPKDSDGDGIPDSSDACPTQPGPRSDDPAKNGCPPPKDTDGDGIPDAKDACPTEAGPQSDDPAKNGCPLPKDTDGDGYLDNVDKCPTEPETFNGFQDADGCPDEVPAEVKKFTGVIEGINYKTNSAEITNKSFPVLDKAFKVLSDYADIRIEISGHTDNVGKDSYNKELSQKRADAVKAYFVSKGINESRLISVGFGEEKPIADNKTKAGKAKNRRTEFRLLTGNN